MLLDACVYNMLHLLSQGVIPERLPALCIRRQQLGMHRKLGYDV